MTVDYTEKCDDKSSIGILCYQIATLSKQKSEAMFQQASLNISTDQAWILAKANEKGREGVYQSELVTKEQIVGAKSQVSRLIQDLVEKDYLLRRVDPNDRRQTYLIMTHEGMKVLQQVEEIILKRKNSYLHSLSPEEYRTLLVLLHKALHAVQNY
ncbi:MarR family transcriptional regulator [Vibrio brasiliensis]|uniref:MarR family winged helix-turn-helix transcriptional regulator n=1 Tax=Vibrio brasiliensis TaxID=170652 RepID=UPI001EFC5152|nr:winged helix DNA-binding protein [Vibrio brasiliensis]MCG9651276.1 MarR family transcriptional regulator [Vibrio brasiliensis]